MVFLRFLWSALYFGAYLMNGLTFDFNFDCLNFGICKLFEYDTRTVKGKRYRIKGREISVWPFCEKICFLNSPSCICVLLRTLRVALLFGKSR